MNSGMCLKFEAQTFRHPFLEVQKQILGVSDCRQKKKNVSFPETLPTLLFWGLLPIFLEQLRIFLLFLIIFMLFLYQKKCLKIFFFAYLQTLKNFRKQDIYFFLALRCKLCIKVSLSQNIENGILQFFFAFLACCKCQTTVYC